MQKNISNTVKNSLAWQNILGDTELFTMENRLFSLMCFIAMVVEVVFFIINAALGYWPICLLVTVVFFIEAVFYYFSRFKAVYKTNIIINGILSYLALIVSYYFDAGIDGPIIFLFFFTFLLLAAGTPKRLHIYWVVLHIITISALLYIDNGMPNLIKYVYTSRAERVVDILSCYIVTLACIFSITRFLFNYYQREKEQAQQWQHRLNAFFEGAGSHYVLLNKQLEIIYFNHAAACFVKQTYGKQLAEGLDITNFLHKQFVETFLQRYHIALNGESYNNEHLLHYAGKGDIWWNISLVPVIDKKGKIAGVALSYTDITLRKSQEEKIQQNNQALMEIARMQSHDMRQPVSSILGMIGLIKDDYENRAEYLPYLKDAVNELDVRINSINF